MKIDLITRPQLEVINKKGLKYPLAEAERDYFLAVILKIINNSDLYEILVFKGGTAIHHCYLDQLRFSKDLDFTSLRSISLTGLENVFRDHDFIGIKNFNEKKYSVDFSLQYQGILQQPSSINVNINTNQKVLLEINKSKFKNNYGVEVEVNLLNIKEIAAEKIRTLNERARARDLYDLYLVKKKFDLDLKEIINILSRKESFKPISKESLVGNIQTILESYSSEMERLYHREHVQVDDLKGLMEKIVAVF